MEDIKHTTQGCISLRGTEVISNTTNYWDPSSSLHAHTVVSQFGEVGLNRSTVWPHTRVSYLFCRDYLKWCKEVKSSVGLLQPVNAKLSSIPCIMSSSWLSTATEWTSVTPPDMHVPDMSCLSIMCLCGIRQHPHTDIPVWALCIITWCINR